MFAGVKFIVFIVCALAFAQGSWALENGVAPEPEIAASTVLVQLRLGNEGWWSICSGVIVAPDTVVTAAHCLPDDLAQVPVRILFAADDGRPDQPALIAEAVEINSKFNRDEIREYNDFDMGWVRFKDGLPIGYKPAAVRKFNKLQPGTVALVAGFGSSGNDKYDIGVLRAGKMIVADPEFSATEALLQQHDGTRTCDGDSGGPAFIRDGGAWILFGIVSRDRPPIESDCQDLTVYTRFDAIRAWMGR